MDPVVIEYNSPTLESVNQSLLRKLHSAINVLEESNTGALLEVATAVARLNSSSKNNDMLSKPKNDAEQLNDQLKKRFNERLGEATVV